MGSRIVLSPDDARVLVARYSGHSLRAGFVTAATANGASERAIMAQTGHRSLLVARRYIRSGAVWNENAAAGLL